MTTTSVYITYAQSLQVSYLLTGISSTVPNYLGDEFISYKFKKLRRIQYREVYTKSVNQDPNPFSLG
jgi:hypothetical protein